MNECEVRCSVTASEFHEKLTWHSCLGRDNDPVRLLVRSIRTSNTWPRSYCTYKISITRNSATGCPPAHEQALHSTQLCTVHRAARAPRGHHNTHAPRAQARARPDASTHRGLGWGAASLSPSRPGCFLRASEERHLAHARRERLLIRHGLFESIEPLL